MGDRCAGAFRSLVVWAVVASTAASGCALRQGAGGAAARGPGAVQARLDSYPLGTDLRVRLRGGERVSGVLVWIDRETLSIESAPPQPPRVIPRSLVTDVSEYTSGDHKVATALVVAGLLVLGYLIYVLVAHGDELGCGPCLPTPSAR